MFSISGTKTARRAIAVGPTICGISGKGGECYDAGTNPAWLAERIREAFPVIGAFQARVLAAGSVLMAGGRVTGLRRARISKAGGYTYTLKPGKGWSRSGALAKPAGKLP